MEIVNILLFFLLPANIVLLFLFYFKKDRIIDYYLLSIFSYGAAPLMSALFFRYLILMFPEKNNAFYLLTIFTLWVVLFIISLRNIGKLKFFYKEVYVRVKNKISLKVCLLYLPILFFAVLFSVQALFYPIVDGDSAYYINQSRAIYEYKNTQWESEPSVIIGGNEEYRFNPMIRPAEPYFTALTFMLSGNNSDYFSYKFLNFYYYILLYLIFIYLVRELAEKLGNDQRHSIFFGSLFFLFFGGLVRTLAFNAKESVIYFMTMLGVYLIYNLLRLKKRDIFLEILLGTAIGFNTFVNVSGIIIGMVLTIILFIFSNLSFWQRFKQVTTVLVVHIFFGALEFIFNFMGTFGSILNVASNLFEKIAGGKSSEQVSYSNLAGKRVIEEHLKLYQVNSLRDMYLKGKFQILTNVAIFGFYFWLFLLALFSNFRNMVQSKLARVILSFVGIYFFLVIDPFNLDKSPLAVVLWGSTKYAKLILLVGLIIVSVYFKKLSRKMFFYAKRYQYATLWLFVVLLVASVVFKEQINVLALKILLLTSQVYKDVSFYENKIRIFYICVMIFLLLIIFTLLLTLFKKRRVAFYSFIFSVSFLFIIVPFFIISNTKVPLFKTFDYLVMDNDSKLKNILNSEGKYDVYFYAKKTLPKNVFIKTTANELYIYNNYFRLARSDNNNIRYEIERECRVGWEEIYSSINFRLCKNKT